MGAVQVSFIPITPLGNPPPGGGRKLLCRPPVAAERSETFHVGLARRSLDRLLAFQGHVGLGGADANGAFVKHVPASRAERLPL